MKVSITKKEYRLLLDMLFLSEWMMSTYNERPESDYQWHSRFRQKLLSYYKEMDAKGFVEYFEEMNQFYETESYMDMMYEHYVVPHNENVFWAELIDRLAERDLIDRVGCDAYDSMDFLERMEQLNKIKIFYENEFECHGLNDLKVEVKNKVMN
ncbi:MAG: hypothetical protein ACE365_00420 [Gammaproteobacteria bacterium]